MAAEVYRGSVEESKTIKIENYVRIKKILSMRTNLRLGG
jgi:hypothetical protein